MKHFQADYEFCHVSEVLIFSYNSFNPALFASVRDDFQPEHPSLPPPPRKETEMIFQIGSPPFRLEL